MMDSYLVSWKNVFSVEFKLADTLPQQIELSIIGILIGSDYYNKIMLS